MGFSLKGISQALSSRIGGSTSSAKLMVSLLFLIIIVSAVFVVHSWSVREHLTLSSLQGRFHTLLHLSEEYKTLKPSSPTAPQSNVDVAAVFAQVSENMTLGSRVNRITPDGRNQSVEINRLYAEELVTLHKQLTSRGVKIIAAEIRALPSGKERLFTISAIIGTSNT